MQENRKIDYKLLSAKAVKTPTFKTPQKVRKEIETENPGINFPEFDRFFIADKHVVPKGAQIFKDLNYMNRIYDFHFVKKDGGLNNVLYIVK